MSSSAHKRKPRRDKQKYPEQGNRDEYSESRPRTYNRESDPYTATDEALSRLQLDSKQTETYYPTENAQQSSGKSRGKGKEKQSRDDGNEWSAWVWHPTYNCYYSSRLNSLGEYDFKYDKPNPGPGESHEQSHAELDPVEGSPPNYTTGTNTTYGTDPGFSQNTQQVPQLSSYQIQPSPSSFSGTAYLGEQPQYGYDQSSAGGTGAVYETGYVPSPDPQISPPPVLLPPPINLPCKCGSHTDLCGILIWPKEPEPTDGRVADKGRSSSRRSGNLRGKAASSSKSDNFIVKGPDGKNCGPLWVPGITPGPPPAKPPPWSSKEETYEYDQACRKWDRGYDEWKQITCPCGYGYFNTEGVWIPGGEARDGKRNPLWAQNGGRAPSAEGRPDERNRLRLCERNTDNPR